MPLTKNQIHLLEHSLGGKDPKKWYRNYFMASPGHSDLPDLEKLESEGFMKRHNRPIAFCDDESILFRVTEAGKKVVSDNQ